MRWPHEKRTDLINKLHNQIRTHLRKQNQYIPKVRVLSQSPCFTGCPKLDVGAHATQCAGNNAFLLAASSPSSEKQSACEVWVPWSFLIGWITFCTYSLLGRANGWLRCVPHIPQTLTSTTLTHVFSSSLGTSPNINPRGADFDR